MNNDLLQLTPVDREHFRLLKPFQFGKHKVPEGYVTDLDSVPRIPIFYLVFKGRTRKAAVVHDYLYFSRMDRKTADSEFLQLMELERVRRRYRLPIYWAVRLLGGSRYKKKSPLACENV